MYYDPYGMTDGMWTARRGLYREHIVWENNVTGLAAVDAITDGYYGTSPEAAEAIVDAIVDRVGV